MLFRSATLENGINKSVSTKIIEMFVSVASHEESIRAPAFSDDSTELTESVTIIFGSSSGESPFIFLFIFVLFVLSPIIFSFTFTSVATSSATGMKRGVHREDQINVVDDDIEECAEHSEIYEEVCEEDNAEKIDGEEEDGEEEHGEEEEEEEEVFSGGDGDDNDVEEEDRNDNGEKDEKRMRHNLSIIEELQAANILQYIPKCLFS